MKQHSLASLACAQKKQQTRKEKCLSDMERCMPWEAFMALMAPRYLSVGRRGGEPAGLAVMPRIYLARQWFGLSAPFMEDSLYDMAPMGHFAGLALNAARIPDESAILQFRHMLARHHLTQGLFEAVDGRLREQG